jgi:hypothetical protein
MREAVAALTAFLLASGCAAAPPPAPKQAWDVEAERNRPARAGASRAGETPAPAPGTESEVELADVAALDAAAYAKRYPRAEFCEEAARKLQRSSRDKAWEVLRACVVRGKFTLLARLVDGGWTSDLKTRQDASLLLARVVAMRGGDVTGDLAQMRQQRIPLFSIGPALSHPDVYRGRLVLFRAEVRDVKLAAGKATVKLAEFAIGNSETYVGEGTRSTWGANSKGRYSNNDRYSSERSFSGSAYSQGERRLTSNVPVETGLGVIAKLPQVDPFFEPGRQFVVLGRFDGVRDEEGEEVDQASRLALVSVVAYYEPSPSVVE